MLNSKSHLLEQSNVNFYNATGVFDKEPGIIYEDDCCHYNQLGNEMLADFIAQSILQSGEF